MKINDLLGNFEIYKTNEELAVLEKLSEPCQLDQFNEREQVIIQNLARKSLITKVSRNQSVLILKNDY